MLHLLMRCSVLALLHLSAGVQLYQKPRFVGVRPGRSVTIYCVWQKSLPAYVEWSKARTNTDQKQTLLINPRMTLLNKITNASITIRRVIMEDSGIYFCKMNGTEGPGTELQVSRHSDPQSVLKRSRVKDVIIVFQGILLILCLVVPLVRFKSLDKKEEIVYEEPEDDHTYEGLNVDQCGCDLYEDISALAMSPDQACEVEYPNQE